MRLNWERHAKAAASLAIDFWFFRADYAFAAAIATEVLQPCRHQSLLAFQIFQMKLNKQLKHQIAGKILRHPSSKRLSVQVRLQLDEPGTVWQHPQWGLERLYFIYFPSWDVVRWCDCCCRCWEAFEDPGVQQPNWTRSGPASTAKQVSCKTHRLRLLATLRTARYRNICKNCRHS